MSPPGAPAQALNAAHPAARPIGIQLPTKLREFAYNRYGLRVCEILDSGYCGLHVAAMIEGLEELEARIFFLIFQMLNY